MRRLIILVFITLLFLGADEKIDESSQLILVSTDDWNASNGVLQKYQKESGQWYKIGDDIAIKVGENGLGWGIGLHKTPADAPYPYEEMSKDFHCVDDSDSKYYNKIVDSKKVKKDYNSYEVMEFDKNYYKYGLVVDHNPKAVPLKGSCIFLHIKSIPTMGCTAMSEEAMLELLKWLDPAKTPILIQAPKGEIVDLLQQANIFLDES
ncbi:MAG: L,D-transpeptidase family protein [Sulfurovaceae bacterium]